MTKTSTCVLQETAREVCRKTSMFLLHVTDREVFCRGWSSGSEGRTQLRRKRDESLDTVLALLALLALRGFGGISRNRDTATMLWVGSR